MNSTKIREFVDKFWAESALNALCDYVRIPAVSTEYDKEWKEHGFLKQAVELVAKWSKKQGIDNVKTQILELPNFAPFLYMDIPAYGDCSSDQTIVFTGHLDKMPVDPSKWSDGLHPWTPVIKNDRLFGRGAADDGFAVFASITAIKALEEQNIPHCRCVFAFETNEESGSAGFEEYLQEHSDLFGNPGLIVNLDTGCNDHDHLWCSYSTRGITDGTLTVKVMENTKHSGTSTGIVPTPGMIACQLLARVENFQTGEVLLSELKAEISDKTKERAKKTAALLGEGVYGDMHLLSGVKPLHEDPYEIVLNNSWRPTVCLTGFGSLPAIENAYSALHPEVKMKLSFRLPPSCDSVNAAETIKRTLEKDPPFGAHVEYKPATLANGWSQEKSESWFDELVDSSSKNYFGGSCMYDLLGGTIGILDVLQKRYPKALFFVAGLLGYKSNEHGPDENLHIEVARKISCCLVDVVGGFSGRKS